MKALELALRLSYSVPAKHKEKLCSALSGNEKQDLSYLHLTMCKNSNFSKAYAEICRLLKSKLLNQLVDDISNQKINVIRPVDKGFPEALYHIEDRPGIMFTIGDPALLKRDMIAIVGTRKSSEHSGQIAFDFAENLAGIGFVIVSGAAAGIDTMAHQGAGPGSTIAVLGGGFNHIFPSRNRDLVRQIMDSGLVISEFPPWFEPRPWCFPRRNRLVSGLCRAVVVIQAPLRSGSLITARHAMEQGREVYVLSGKSDDASFRGSHELLRQGARIICSQEHLLEDLSSIPLGFTADLYAQRKINHGNSDRSAILIDSQHLNNNIEAKAHLKDKSASGPAWARPESVTGQILRELEQAQNQDKLAINLNISVSQLTLNLLELQLQGAVKSLPGNCWIRQNWVRGFLG
jgi:DNA processing protein